MTQPDWNYEVTLSDLPGGNGTFSLEANAAEREVVAARLDIPVVKSLKGNLTITPTKGGAKIAGTLDAALMRKCVASLDPMEEVIAEEIDVAFSRDSEIHREGDDLILSESAEELFEGDVIDIADFLVQQLALTMAPYPRKPDARNLADDFSKIGESSPFSILKDIQNKPQNNH